jgi:hypothetical protein
VIRGTVLHIFVRGEMGIGVSVANTDERYRASTVRQICVLYSSSLLILHCFFNLLVTSIQRLRNFFKYGVQSHVCYARSSLLSYSITEVTFILMLNNWDQNPFILYSIYIKESVSYSI